jgi:hypothetical protein
MKHPDDKKHFIAYTNFAFLDKNQRDTIEKVGEMVKYDYDEFHLIEKYLKDRYGIVLHEAEFGLIHGAYHGFTFAGYRFNFYFDNFINLIKIEIKKLFGKQK